jgi:hypothetical protein
MDFLKKEFLKAKYLNDKDIKEIYSQSSINFIKKCDDDFFDKIKEKLPKYHETLSFESLRTIIQNIVPNIENMYLIYIVDKLMHDDKNNKNNKKKLFFEITEREILSKFLNNIEFTTNTNVHKFLIEQFQKREEKFANFSLIIGDVQVGKTESVLVTIWILIFHIKKKVLLCFQNLNQDEEQFLKRIESFNKTIKNIIDDYNHENLEMDNHLKDEMQNFFILEHEPMKLKNWKKNQHAKKPNFTTCLLNNIQTDIEDLNILSDYVCIIDEFDIVSPSGNNFKLKKNKKTTKIEQNISQIIKNVYFTIGITATPLTLLPNRVTELNKNIDYDYIDWYFTGGVVLKPKENYMGIDKCEFIEYPREFFKDSDSDSDIWELERDNFYSSESSYSEDNIDIDDIYLKSIKDDFPQHYKNYKFIIKNIIENNERDYRSIIIADYHNTVNHENLANYIIESIKKIFIIINNGEEIKFYFPKKYFKYIEKSIISENNKDNKSKYDIILNNTKKKIKHGDFNYFLYTYNKKGNVDINFIYELLSILTKKTQKKIYCLTIAGKLAGRGFSYVSNNFNNYQFHLTDQIILKLKTTFASQYQSCRVFGKYHDYKKNYITIHTISEIKYVLDAIKELNIEIKHHVPLMNNEKEIKNFCETIENIRSKKFLFNNTPNVLKIQNGEIKWSLPVEFDNDDDEVNKFLEKNDFEFYDEYNINDIEIYKKYISSVYDVICIIKNTKEDIQKYVKKKNLENINLSSNGTKMRYEEISSSEYVIKNKGWGIGPYKNKNTGEKKFKHYRFYYIENEDKYALCYWTGKIIPKDNFENYNCNPKEYEEKKRKKMFEQIDDKIFIINSFLLFENIYIYKYKGKYLLTEQTNKTFNVLIKT